MNELEKMSSQTDDTLPTSENVEEVNTENTVAEATPATAENETIADDVCSEADDTDDTDEVSAEDEASARSWHDKTKEELVTALREIVEENRMSQHKDVAAIKQAFHAIRSKEIESQSAEFVEGDNKPETFVSTPDELEYEFKELLTRFKEGRAEFLAAEESRLAANLEEKKTIIANIRDIVEDIDNINLHFPRFQQLQADFKAIKEVTPGADNDIWKEYQTVVELFYDRLKMNKELRDLDFKKNLETKRELIEKAKALGEDNDAVGAFRQLQELHTQWRETGPVAKEYRESIWAEFSAASTVVNKRHQQFFEQRKEAEKNNEIAKTGLCEEIEAIDLTVIDSFNKWDAATKQVLDLQARWKGIGFASKKVNNDLFARFRKSCDDFFTAKAEYYKRVKEELASNLEKKTRLCEQVEALLESEDRNKAADKVIELQKEWKTIGGVARRQSDQIWERFTTACNKFFEERKRKNSETRRVENENMAAKREVIEKLKEINTDETPRNEGLPVVRELQARWQSIGHVPYKMKDKLYEDYRKECDRIYDAYAASNSRRNMSNFSERIENLSGGDSQLSRERDRLYRTYEQKRAELKTIENNMGFFNVKSNDGGSLVKDMEKKIARLKEDLNDLKRKIELIDEKLD